jgi:Holliday junction DNA helicase RuvA
MIAALKGVLLEKSAADVIVDVNGVGYRVYVSLMTLAQMPGQGSPVQFRIRTVVREDALDLFGFLTRPEEELFLLLTSVSHVGPKMAMNVLSGLDTQELVSAIAKGEVARLTRIQGVGKKTAERLVLELRDKAKLLAVDGKPSGGAPQQISASNDLTSALLNLGFKEAQADGAMRIATERHGADAPFELLFREALKTLRAG